MPKKKSINKKDEIEPAALPFELMKAWTDTLSVRSRNVLNTYLYGNEDNAQKWLPLFDPNFRFTSIQNCGATSEAELRLFFADLKKKVLRLQAMDKKDRLWLGFEILACKRFGLPLPVSKKHNLLSLIDAILTKSASFKKVEREAIKELHAVYTDRPKKMTDLTSEFPLTTERVRQVRYVTLKKLEKMFLWLRNHQPLFIEIGRSKQPIKLVDTALCKKLNEKYGVNFSRYFLTWYIARVHPGYTCLGDVQDVVFSTKFSSRNRHNWRNIYAVSTSVPSDKLSETVETLDRHVRSLRKMRSTLSIGDFMPKKVATKATDPEWNAALKILLRKEFDLDLDADGRFQLLPNGHRHLVDYFYDILSERMEVASANEIVKILNEQYPEVKCKSGSVAGLTRRDDRFVHLGKGIFGLAHWDIETPEQVKGSIREFVFEYLSEMKRPVSLGELTEYIQDLRPETYQWSIVANIKQDKANDYHFEDGFVSLKQPKKRAKPKQSKTDKAH